VLKHLTALKPTNPASRECQPSIFIIGLPFLKGQGRKMTCVKCQHTTVKKFGRYGRQRVQRYRCLSCKTTFSDPKPESPLGDMRIDTEDGLKALHCLLEGCSIRSTERLTEINRNTIMGLLVTAGERCAKLLDEKMRGLKSDFIQSDEIWCFVNKKQKRCRDYDPAEFGDAWVFVAIDPVTKLIPSFTVGKRSAATTQAFIDDLAQRLAKRVQITTDGFRFYVNAIEKAFGCDVDFAQLIKLYGDYGQHDSATKYSPSPIFEVISKIIQGNPDEEKICTSHVERQNLTMRMMMRRFTRLTNAFSKKLENLKAACALHFAYYNFCRVHQTLRVTPCMEAGVTDHIWSIRELLESR
jgi:IS1 family transposase/transposase-like protein